MSCSNCNAPLEKNARFCLECGAKATAQPKAAPKNGAPCVSCGAVLEAGAPFCVECGMRQDKKAAPKGPATSPAPKVLTTSAPNPVPTSAPNPLPSEASLSCLKCGEALGPGVVFCTECGTNQKKFAEQNVNRAAAPAPKLSPAPTEQNVNRAAAPAPKLSPAPTPSSKVPAPAPTPAPQKIAPAPAPTPAPTPTPQASVLCGGCQEEIKGPGIKALDKDWHRACFVCSQCKGAVNSNFAVRNGQPLCDGYIHETKYVSIIPD
jgi:hypothetical protein